MKKLRHLRLRKPNTLIFNTNCDVEFSTLRLVNDYLVLIDNTGHNIFLHFAPFCKKNGSSRIARKRSTIPPFLVLGAIYKNLAEKILYSH